ncbi:MAG: putative transferase transmembrane protein [Candidatus Collierbacteria bacterium GW2011_GWB1_44_6]|uniref:Putative transferase transmembrane protein n=2 Tax=Candidatus Collieribacteriota TaxID=1752725 RepID=A0A0G1JQN3_9BACT|nr:MAG: putative transferase transmembrane protein [Candidatus Collierbacteria bacterium GW2011_GWC2_43_12]KKT73841.1 MAG: putative transferase transmembrane protein [Candidatus Collierbacteria bacterium GW2011_GWB1_44_6]KKT84129.1 MAG: putative transferase transmembrane protein [Microgenomates group bacterium GW2011_GWC1_44_9]
MSNERYTKLDGLRGLLSVIVALNHSFLVIAIPSYANVWGQNYLEFYDLQSKLQQVFMLLGNGGVAVTLFFILSGLVLGQSLSRIEFSTRGLTSFYTKRILRLYPVYAFVILLIAVYMKLGFAYQTFPMASAWYNWWMNFDMTLKEFIYNFFFIHTYLGGVTWTLRVILIASFIFPAFYLIYRKTTPFLDLLITVGLLVAGFTVLNIPDFRDLRYLYMFYAGLCLPKFKSFLADLPPRAISLLATPVTLALLASRYVTDEYIGGVVETVIGWFIIGIIVYSNKTRLFDFLNKQIFQFLGKISYSLYLIHFSILYILARLMFAFLPNLPYASHYITLHSLLFGLSLLIAVYISVFVHRFVEQPSSTLANTIGQKIVKK